MNTIRFLITAFLFFSLATSFAQVTNDTVDVSDFDEEHYKKYKGEDAVVLYDFGTASFKMTNKDFLFKVERHTRIRILKSSGFDWANIEIPHGLGDNIINLKAYTYNLVDGKVEITPLPKKDVYYQGFKQFGQVAVFALPKVREGSIIEYRYTLKTDDWVQLYPWKFQWAIPVKHSEFYAYIPEFLTFRINTYGFHPFETKTVTRFTFGSVNRANNLGILNASMEGDIYRWVKTDLPAFRPERFINSVQEYIDRVEFMYLGSEMSDIYKPIVHTYLSYNNHLLTSDFGRVIQSPSYLYNTSIKLVKGITTDHEKIITIRNHLAKYIQWNGLDDYMVNQTFSKTYKDREGSVADINLLLVLMLRDAGLRADPVILSTRENGMLNPAFLVASKFNYVLAHVQTADREYLLDATDSLLPYNQLPEKCMNGQGWLVTEFSPRWIDILKHEQHASTTIANLTVDDNGILTGTIEIQHQGYEAHAIRKYLTLYDKDEYLKELILENAGYVISDFKISNPTNKEEPVKESYSIRIDDEMQQSSNRWYFTPMVTGKTAGNPFIQEKRYYPIDFGAPISERLIINVQLPQGYEIEEMPVEEVFDLPERGGRFAFSATLVGNQLNIVSQTSITKTFFLVEEYKSLKSFFDFITLKHAQLVVLKKI